MKIRQETTRMREAGRTTPPRRSLAIAAALLTATASTAVGLQAATASASSLGPAYSGHLVYWFWGESDVPGITKWVQNEIKAYEQIHPKVSITMVPQGTNTLIGAFETAGSTKSGPDIATQWATLPTLTPVWQGYVAPLTGLVPESSMKTWLNTSENTFQNKVWAMPIYLLGTPFVWNKTLFKKAGLNPNVGPQTWSQLLADAAKLKAAGITPIEGGDSDGALGSWLTGVVGDQDLNSVSQIESLATGSNNMGQPAYKDGLNKIEGLIKSGYFPNNVSSITLAQGWQQFVQGKGAMTWSTDGNVISWESQMPKNVLGVERTPVWGNGKLASYYDSTQSSDAFITSWSTHKAEAAAFLTWLKAPAQVASFYKSTGAFPASTLFSASQIQSPVTKELYNLDTHGDQVWTENYWPPSVDTVGVRPALEDMFTGGSVSQAISVIAQNFRKWQVESPSQVTSFKNWLR
jgi:ABC-type glycerol-3-phosphate transport system substrate-binding protein